MMTASGGAEEKPEGILFAAAGKGLMEALMGEGKGTASAPSMVLEAMESDAG